MFAYAHTYQSVSIVVYDRPRKYLGWKTPVDGISVFLASSLEEWDQGGATPTRALRACVFTVSMPQEQHQEHALASSPVLRWQSAGGGANVCLCPHLSKCEHSCVNRTADAK